MRRPSFLPLLLLSLPSAVTAGGVLQAVLRGTAGNEDIFGLAQISEADDGTVTVEASVQNLPDGLHGFHIHQYGDVVGADDGTAAGGHYNPLGRDHAGPDDGARHVGDLGNIESSGGTATYERVFEATDPSRPTVTSLMSNSAIGRSFIIHADPDDLTSQPTGNAGPRLAAGIIGIASPAEGGADVVEHIGNEDFETPTALVCALYDADSVRVGSAYLVMADGGGVKVTAAVSSLTPGLHGFHVHQYGTEFDFAAADGVALADRDLTLTAGHYNPTSALHGLPPEANRHYGDIGNLDATAEGVAPLSAVLPDGTTLSDLVGRTCLVHADPDDGSDPAGNAGPRIIAGQLGYANPETEGPQLDDEGATDPQADEPASGGAAWRSALALVYGSSLTTMVMAVAALM